MKSALFRIAGKPRCVATQNGFKQVATSLLGSDQLFQELMSDEAAKERATTAYARVPSKSKLLASELPNMETCSSI